MPEDEILDGNVHRDDASFTRVTTETVRRGDLYVPLADRFDKLEKRVSLLTWVVIIDIVLTLTSNSGFLPELVRLLDKLST